LHNFFGFSCFSHKPEKFWGKFRAKSFVGEKNGPDAKVLVLDVKVLVRGCGSTGSRMSKYWSLDVSNCGNTSVFTSVEEEDTLLYPSVTVCKKYTFDQYKVNILLNESVTIIYTKVAIVENSWTREKVFYFLSHPKMENLTFPCTHNLGRWN
jgi:hypothetical protein